MAVSIILGFLLIVESVFIHALTTEICTNWADKRVALGRKLTWRSKVFSISWLVFILFLAAILEAMLWALTYWLLGAIQDFEEAVYFSVVTYTTLGYGDVVLGDNWRLLSAFQAANGVIIFGWSTAIVMTLVHRIFGNRSEESTTKR